MLRFYSPAIPLCPEYEMVYVAQVRWDDRDTTVATSAMSLVALRSHVLTDRQEGIMSRIHITFSIILVIVGGAAYAVSEFASWTALIPAFLGLALVACALVGMIHRTIGAILGLVVAIIGVAGTTMNVIELGSLFTGDAVRPAAIVTSTIAFVLLVLYAVLVIRNLVTTARENRNPAKVA